MKKQRLFYLIERITELTNNFVMFVTFILALFWVIDGELELEAFIAFLGIISMIFTKTPSLLEKFGYEKYPLGKGVMSKGGCWIDEGKEEFKIKLSYKINSFKTKIDYIPTERVMAHFKDNYLVFKRRAGDSGHRLRVDYEIIKKD